MLLERDCSGLKLTSTGGAQASGQAVPALRRRPAGAPGRAALVRMRSREMTAPDAAVPATKACSQAARLCSVQGQCALVQQMCGGTACRGKAMLLMHRQLQAHGCNETERLKLTTHSTFDPAVTAPVAGASRLELAQDACGLHAGMCRTGGDSPFGRGGPVCAREEAERLQRTVLLELGRLPQQ